MNKFNELYRFLYLEGVVDYDLFGLFASKSQVKIPNDKIESLMLSIIWERNN